MWQPEQAARIGRDAQRRRPLAVRPDWDAAKLAVMRSALAAKFGAHPLAAALLLSTGERGLVEASPHDAFWGAGPDGRGRNHLGRMLQALRDELRTRGAAGGG